MASKPREQSISGFYHVYQRGVNLFDIFEDNVDRGFYIARLKRYAAEFGVEIHAWCLMSNHTHLLLKADLPLLSALMRKLGSVYARYFNSRHGRSGPLFGGRFCSVCVDSDPQLLSVVRYIHRNPIHHEETTLCGLYPWSSYREYISAASETCKLDYVLGVFGSISELIRFHSVNRDHERHLDIGTTGRMSDDEARQRADNVLQDRGFDVTAQSIGTLPKALRDKAIACVKREIRCSLRQLQRLTSIAYSTIRNAVESKHPDQANNRAQKAQPVITSAGTRIDGA